MDGVLSHNGPSHRHSRPVQLSHCATGHNSEYYGNCEVCHKHCSEVFIQVQSRYYFFSDVGVGGWGYNECHTLFGHETCIRARRRLMAPRAASKTVSVDIT